jgi:transposase InsO family protein
MSKVLTKYSDTILIVPAHHTFMATAKMGHRYSRIVDDSTGKLQVCSGCDRIFHKMDRNKASSQHCSSRTEEFFWQNIICHFGVPKEITVDNAKQFDYHIFKEFCCQIRVEAAFTSVYHPQSNGAVEKANGFIFTAIKKILENQPKGNWAEELPRVVWSHNTSVCRATKFTPFKLLSGEEPVTPEEIKLRSARTKMEATYSPSEAESKDLLEPERMKAVENLQSYQNETRAWRDRKVKLKHIKAGDLVLL